MTITMHVFSLLSLNTYNHACICVCVCVCVCVCADIGGLVVGVIFAVLGGLILITLVVVAVVVVLYKTLGTGRCVC